MINLRTKRIDRAFKNLNPDIIKYGVSDIIDYDTQYYRPKYALFVAEDFHIFKVLKKLLCLYDVLEIMKKGNMNE